MLRVPLVILGGGAAAAKLAQAYRAAGGSAGVVLVSAESIPPYHRPLLTQFCLEDTYGPDEIAALPSGFYRDAGIDLRLGVRAVRIDACSRRVVLSDGNELQYETLVVATGSTPRLPKIRGASLAGVATFRTYQDACALREDRSDRVVVVGGGFLGCELAAAVKNLGRHVTLVERAAGLLPGLRCPELSVQLADHFRRNGVQVLLEESVAEAHGRHGALESVRTSSGLRLPATRLVFAVGADPDNALLRAAGARIWRGACVDERLATSLPDVFAIGDVCGLPCGGHWSVAAEHGETLGKRLAGDRTDGDGAETLRGFHLRLFDARLHAIGDFHGDVDEVVLTGSITQRRLLVLLRRHGSVVAGVAMGQRPSTLDELRRRIRAGDVETDAGAVATDGAVLAAA